MRTVFLAGGIASGKSTVARELERRGWRRVDLDELSRRVLEPATATTEAVAEAFGADLLNPATGAVDRGLLAARAFATPAGSARLEEIELPAIRELLARTLCELEREGCPACLVEVPLLDRMADMLEEADEVLVVCCPLEVRRARAIGRGMAGEDFDVRVRNQPSDEWLRAHATYCLDNGGTPGALIDQLDAWLRARGWEGPDA